MGRDGILRAAALALGVALLLGAAPANAETVTVATFADPSQSSNDPLFTVDLGLDRLYGGWAQGKLGLDLQIVLTGDIFYDAYFTLSDGAGNPWVSCDQVQANFAGPVVPSDHGWIRFFASDGSPLFRVEFDAAYLTPGGIGADELVSFDDVRIRGPALPGGGTDLVYEAFGFSFANQIRHPGPTGDPSDDIMTATASFTSSAVIPEPSMAVLLGVGLMTVVGRRRA